ncbi:MAG: methyltransferase domain-containing protein [bacterium]
MNKTLLNFLCDPIDKTDLSLNNEVLDELGRVVSGTLTSKTGNVYQIIDGIPRFIKRDLQKSVVSFGDEWNYFNFDFKENWLDHTIKNTFGTTDIFKDKVVVDAGGGSGMQSLWMSQAGAKHVICLELSDSVDDIVKKNLIGINNVDVVQCSIDQPPIKDNSIEGIVICHNVIQHTPSVEKTAEALWKTVGAGGEFVFNCYPKNDLGFVRKIRLGIYYFLRNFLSKRSFKFILIYSKIMAIIRFIPVIGYLLEKSNFMIQGDVPAGPNYIKRAYWQSALNTFDSYGSHEFQHLKSDDEIRDLINKLQPNGNKILNQTEYFSRPKPIGVALRLLK